MATTVLIVDDEPVQRRLLDNIVTKMGHRTHLAENGEEALAYLAGPSGSAVSVIVLDLVMPGMCGLDVLAKLRELGAEQPVIVQTAKGGIDTVVEAIRAGASDFCAKPVSPERLSVSIQNALKMGAMKEVVSKIRKSGSGTLTFKDMIADSALMQKVVKLGQRAAASNIPVLIEGESGVGKEIIAQAIQGESERRGKPFVTVNCAALPEHLVESILFGHEKGAFTGAVTSHVGKFKEADGGTLFLDEVGELSLEIQVKLLRALQEGEVDPVGAKRPVKTDFRLISATNRDMLEQVKAGLFREDLYYRLNVFPIHVPALRSRKSDIATLVRLFTARICMEEGRRSITGIRNDALAMLEAYDWPGNIRQLENSIFRAVILCDGDELTIDEFPQVSQAMYDPAMDPVVGNALVASGMRALVNAPSLYKDEIAEKASAGVDQLSLIDGGGNISTLADVEEHVIRFAMDHYRGKMTTVARNLGIGRSTLYRKLKEYGLEETDEV